jgi:hypothetical protein
MSTAKTTFGCGAVSHPHIGFAEAPIFKHEARPRLPRPRPFRT